MNISAIRPFQGIYSKQNNNSAKENPAFGMQLTPGAEAALAVARDVASKSPTSWFARKFRQVMPALAAFKGVSGDHLILDITNPHNKTGLDWLANANAVISRADVIVNRNPASMELKVRRAQPDANGDSIIEHLAAVFTGAEGKFTSTETVRQMVLDAATLPIPMK